MADDPAPPLRRPRGRPRAAEPYVSARMNLPVSDYDRICRIAFRQGESVSATLRGIVVFQLRERERPEE